jgi:hypothetical protein
MARKIDPGSAAFNLNRVLALIEWAIRLERGKIRARYSFSFGMWGAIYQSETFFPEYEGVER